MIQVCLAGARGRMGRMLAELIDQAEDLALVAALERAQHPDLGQGIGPGVVLTSDAEVALSNCHVLLDFSLAEPVVEHVALAARLGKPAVTGTTGFSDSQRAELNKAAQRVALVVGSNMSRGVWAVTRLVRTAAELLDAESYDAEIFEAHHKHKADAPSGTAWQLAEAVRAVRGGEMVADRKGVRAPGEIGLSAMRGGDVVGEHQVFFLGAGEQIVLTHRATTREHFCRGALSAVRFVVDQATGLYGMDDVFALGE